MSEEIITQEEAKVIPPEWTPVRVASLIALWEEGLPTSEIGRRLNVTKNSVVGKVHRLSLTKRKSPIQYKKVKKETIATVVRLESLKAYMCRLADSETGAEELGVRGVPIKDGKL